MPHLMIVVPCFNEAVRISIPSFQKFAQSHPQVQFIMVNDGSSDATLNVLQRLKAEFPANFQILDLKRNVGKGEAVRQGCCLALEQDPLYLGYWDADLAAPLEATEQFLDIFNRFPEIQIVIGSRLSLLGHDIDRNSWRNHLGRIFAWCAATILGVSIFDTQAGHKMFRVSDKLRKIFQIPFKSRWIFDVELLARWIGTRNRVCRLQANHSIYEFPLEIWRDVAGTKLKSTDFIRAFAELIMIGLSFARDGSAPKSVRHGQILPGGRLVHPTPAPHEL